MKRLLWILPMVPAWAGADPALAGPVAPPPERPAWTVGARLGLLLLEEASRAGTSHLSAGLRLTGYVHRFALVDGGYQFAYDGQGGDALSVTTTLHALDVRVHAVLPLRRCELTLGAGLAGYLVTSHLAAKTSDGGTHASTTWGVPVALGVQTWVDRFPVRFELQAATRGQRRDWLLSVQAGL